MNNKKNGSILIKNIFSISIVLLLCFGISSMQNIIIKNTRAVLVTNDILNKVNILRSEIYFNRQYEHLYTDTYIDPNKIEIGSYKVFHELFENNYNNNSPYFYLQFDKDGREVNIAYLDEGKRLFEESLMLN